MKKQLYTLGMLAILGLGTFVNAQVAEGVVGVNTETPQATLDIQPSAANADGTTNEGIIAPKLSKERIAKIAAPVEGTLVYATNATYSGSNVKVADITEKGYYYYNGSKWVKSAGDNTDVANNLYTVDGALTGNRTVGLGNNNLLFTGTGKIGIGAENPKVRLEIEGNDFNSSSLLLRRFENGVTASGLVLQKARGTKDAPEAVQLNDNLGSVGFTGYNGSNYRNAALIINKVDGKVAEGQTIPSRIEFSTVTTSGNYSETKMTIKSDGKVGIGTTTPAEKLEVAGSIKSSDLAGNGVRNVAVDADGKLIVGEATSSDETLTIKKTVKVVPNTVDSGNGLADEAAEGKNLRNYNGTEIPNYADSDYMIVLTNIGVNGKLQLPSAKANPGRIIYLINGTGQGLGFSGLNSDGTSDIYPYNFTTLATRSGVPFVSTGKTWYPIGR